jgi:hypothetical protein
MGPEYFRVLEQSLPNVRYRVKGVRAVLRNIVSPKGEPLPAWLVVELPDGAKPRDEMLIIISVLGPKGEPVGGLTLNVVKGTAQQKGGPYLPKPKR